MIRKLFLFSYAATLLFINGFSQSNIRLRSVLPYDGALSNVWGYVDTAGNEYALVGWYRGLSIVDVTHPDSISELFQIASPNSNWREIKTWDHYAYVTNETGGGLLIVDLSMLPDSIDYHFWTGDTLFNTAHTLYIDENGFLYLFGYNDLRKSIPSDQRGALICDLNQNPETPVIAGRYSANYVHDGYVRGDTLWAAEIQANGFAVIDVTEKANPVILATQETPSQFAHNCWLSDNGNYLFTTDERANAFVTSYDVSDLGNITELDRWQADPGSLLIPHNTYFINNFLVTSYYKYGINILDATHPDNLVEVGYYDTSPFPNGDGFNGCWGVYPYLPSGTILASDMEAGLFVLTPDYKRACYLAGNVANDFNDNPVNEVSVELMTTGFINKTNLQGDYKTGTAEPGNYDVRFYKDGCLPKIFSGIELESGITDTLNVVLTCTTFVGIKNADLNRVSLAALPSVFEGSTSIRFQIPRHEANSLQIFDSNGKLVDETSLRDTEGEIIAGNSFPKGIYIVRLQSANFSQVIKISKI